MAYKIKKLKGFGLLEALLASTIIVLVLAAMSMATQMTIRGNETLMARSQALHLAESALETVRQMRDSSWIDNSGSTGYKTIEWGSGTDNKLQDVEMGQCYKIEQKEYTNIPFYKRFGLTKLSTCESDAAVALDPFDGKVFSQSIKVENVGSGILPDKNASSAIDAADNAIKVTADIYWDEKNKVEVSDILTNWRSN